MHMYKNQCNDQAAGLRRMSVSKPVRVITVTGGKGGVGKTNISANMAVALANKGKKVLLLDADLGLANLDIVLGVEAKYNLSHVVKGEKSLNEVMVEGPSGIMIIPASSGVEEMASLGYREHAGIIREFNSISFTPDILIVDSAAGIANNVVSFSRASHEVLVVVCDEPASITDAYALIKLLDKEHGVKKFRVVTNMVKTHADGRILFNKLMKVTDKFLDVTLDYVGAIPYDEFMKKAIQRQKPVVNAYPRCPSSLAISKYIDKLDQWPIPTSPSGHIEFFFERLFFSKNQLTAQMT